MVYSTVTSERPGEDTDVTSFTPWSCCTVFSIASVIWFATSDALAPG